MRWLVQSRFGANHKMTTAFIAGMIGFLVFSVPTWLYLQHSILGKNVTEIDRNKLHIFIVRTPGYRGATSGPKEEDMHRYVVSSEPLILGSQEKSFAWGIDNENTSALRDARLNFYYWGKVPLQITRTHLGEAGHYWQEYTAGHHYFYEFKKPINERWAHSWGALIIKFPEPGEYRFDLTASGEGIETVNPIKTYLIVNVSELAFPQKQPIPGLTK